MNNPIFQSVYTNAPGSKEHRTDLAHAITDSDDPSAAIVADLRSISALIDPDQPVDMDPFNYDPEQARHATRRKHEDLQSAYVMLQVIADRIERAGVKRPATPPPVRPLTRALADQ